MANELRQAMFNGLRMLRRWARSLYSYEARFDYQTFYRKFDLKKDYWTVVGPTSREEFEALGRGKIALLIEQGLKPNSRILDVGCGTGQLVAGLLDYLASEGRYYGTDIAPEAIEFCREKYRRPNFVFLRNEMTGVPIKGLLFDCIYLGSVFTHMFPDEIQAMLIDLRRLLAPGGVIIADVFLAEGVATFDGSRSMVKINEDFLASKFLATGLAFEPIHTFSWGNQLRRRIIGFTHGNLDALGE
jgi:SAM-dependent methyltransferase